MYGCESWTIKKAEHRRIDAFELWCWKRLLRVPRTARSNQSILKEISPEYSLEGVMLKLKLQYFGHLMGRIDSLEKTLMLGKTEGRRRRGRQRWDGWMASLTRWTWVWASSRNWWWTGKPGMLQSTGSQRVRNNWVTELNWKNDRCPKEKPYCNISQKWLSWMKVKDNTVINKSQLCPGRWPKGRLRRTKSMTQGTFRAKKLSSDISITRHSADCSQQKTSVSGDNRYMIQIFNFTSVNWITLKYI